MKQKYLLLGAGLLASLSVGAVESPYVGSLAPTEGSADFYLYQVESGKWIQGNYHRGDAWSTRGELEPWGMTLGIIKEGEGWRINPKFAHNESMNSGNFYLDTKDGKATWYFEPVEVEGVSNAYKIKADAGFYLGCDDKGNLEKNPSKQTWQLVSHADRLSNLETRVAAGEKGIDVTWLIPGHNFSNEDRHLNEAGWTHKSNKFSGTNWGGKRDWNSIGFCNANGYTNNVFEAWGNHQDFEHSFTITGIPNGKYRFRVDGMYRDGDFADNAFFERLIAGTSERNVDYFANEASAHIYNIDHALKAEKGVLGAWKYREDYGYVPSDWESCAYLIITGELTNPWIEATVTNGTLKVGIRSEHGKNGDYMVYDNWRLEYMGNEIDLTPAKDEIRAILESNNDYSLLPQNIVTEILASANEAIESEDADAVYTALSALKGLSTMFSSTTVANYHATIALAAQEGLETASHMEKYHALTNNGELNAAMKELRHARRLLHSIRTEDLFEGNEPAEGAFYLYNVGQKMFFCGGSDWGAHAALGANGLEITLEGQAADALAFDIRTYGEGKYLNYRGYMDQPKAGKWLFTPVEGKNGIYTITQQDYGRYIAWDLNADTDNNGNNDETTVGTECDGEQWATDPNAWWKLVTREERLALMEDATAEEPVDVSFLISRPGFNRHETGTWERQGFDIWDANGNHSNYACEAWNKNTAKMTQAISNLPTGMYTIVANGYFRNGKFIDTFKNNEAQLLYLFAGEDLPKEEAANGIALFAEEEVAQPTTYAETPFDMATTCSNMAPGEGDNVTDLEGNVHNIPNSVTQGTDFFRLGLYQKSVSIDKTLPETTITIGAEKREKQFDEDWAVVDNFRLLYHGKDASTGVEGVAAEAETLKDGRIYNLQGIEVKNPTAPGIYISNGKKFVIK